MRAFAHERFSREITLSPELVGDYAHSVGDTNPVHHDSAFAAATRFGRLIASRTHTTALLLGLTASHFSKCYSEHFKRTPSEERRGKKPAERVMALA